MRNVVNSLFVRNGSILPARQSPRRRAYPDAWSFPGGHVHERETQEEALIRKLSEEVAVIPRVYTVLDTIIDPNA
jgi:8-oxo-dGTP diphosphatase